MGIFSKKYDTFMSYKSKNVDIARIISDRLIASGRKVWFAEYEVLLTERDRFQEAIDKGIRECKYGIALTNDDYANSEYCEKEMVQLLEYSGPNNIMEIMVPHEPRTHQKYGMLKEGSAHIFTGDVDESLNFIGEKTGWSIVPRIKSGQTLKEEIYKGDCLGEPYSIDVSSWELLDKSFEGGGPCYVQNIEGFDIFWNLQYGEELHPKAYEARLLLARKNEDELYKDLCFYANRYFETYKPDSKAHGIHLFLMKGISHFAMTYHDGKFWKRRHSIMLLHPQTHRIAEFVFTFQFSGNFQQYCRYVEVMDHLVKSLKWGEGIERTKKKDQKSKPIKPSSKDHRLSRIIDDQPMANKLYSEGMALAKQGQIERALSTWKNVLNYTTLAEMRGMVFYNMGLAAEKLRDDQKAIEYYEQSVEANPGQFNALCNIGSIYRKNGNPKEALNYLLKAFNQNPNDHVTINNIIVCYENLGNTEEVRVWETVLRRLK